MKKYIQWFDDKTKAIPVTSEPLVGEFGDELMDFQDWERLGFRVMDWMDKYPNGKIIYIWL